MEQIIKTTPILKHFAELNLPVPGHFNQSMMFVTKRHLNMFTFNAALRILCVYHDMLRAVWDGSQLTLPEPTNPSPFYLEEHNLRNSTDVSADILPLANTLQSTIDVTNGPLMHVAVFHFKDNDAVLFAIHHLVVDGVSWRILVEDLNKIYTTLLQGKLSVNMPKRKCSFMRYAEAVNDYAGSDELASQLPYWTETVQKINCAKSSSKKVTYNYNFVQFKLDEESTRYLTGKAGAEFNADINAIFLTALSRAWKTVTGEDVLSISQEGHGRESFGSQTLALERLIGWFTTIFPVALSYKEGDFSKHVAEVDNMLHRIPNKGFGYGVLRHIANHDELKCEPMMTFNYLGSFDESQTDSFFSIDNTLPQGAPVSRLNFSDTPMSINCGVADGCLAGALSYDKGVMSKDMAKRLSEAFIHELERVVSL